MRCGTYSSSSSSSSLGRATSSSSSCFLLRLDMMCSVWEPGGRSIGSAAIAGEWWFGGESRRSEWWERREGGGGGKREEEREGRLTDGRRARVVGESESLGERKRYVPSLTKGGGGALGSRG